MVWCGVVGGVLYLRAVGVGGVGRFKSTSSHYNPRHAAPPRSLHTFHTLAAISVFSVFPRFTDIVVRLYSHSFKF